MPAWLFASGCFLPAWLFAPGCYPVVIDPSDAEALGMSFGFVLTYLVFFLGINIRVVIIDDGFYPMGEQPFDDGA